MQTATANAVAMVTKDLADMNAYIDAQVKGGRSEEGVLAVQFDALSCRLTKTLAGLNIDVAQGAQLTNAVNSGPWSEAQRATLNASIDGLLASASVGPRNRCQQVCKHPERFLTQAEWRSLRTKGVILSAKIAQLCTRFWTLGVTCPQETREWFA